jgi:phage tail-like protein
MSEPSTLPRVATQRRDVPGLPSPFPLRTQIPPMLQDDPSIVAFLDGLDELIAPVISVLDSFDAYLDPQIAPLDMVRYMGGWVLASMDDVWTEDVVRRDVSRAALRAKWAGTERALRDRLVPFEVRELTVIDPGGTTAETAPTDPSSWHDPDELVVVINVSPKASGSAEIARIERIARTVVPAHVSVRVSVG